MYINIYIYNLTHLFTHSINCTCIQTLGKLTSLVSSSSTTVPWGRLQGKLPLVVLRISREATRPLDIQMSLEQGRETEYSREISVRHDGRTGNRRVVGVVCTFLAHSELWINIRFQEWYVRNLYCIRFHMKVVIGLIRT